MSLATTTTRVTKLEAGLRAANGIVASMIPLFGLGVMLYDQIIALRKASGQPTETLEEARAQFVAAQANAHAASDEFHRLFPDA